MPTRYLDVYLKNNSGFDFQLSNTEAPHGEFVINPPSNIPNGGTGHWSGQSDVYLSGPECWVIYHAKIQDHAITITVHAGLPLEVSNFCSIEVEDNPWIIGAPSGLQHPPGDSITFNPQVKPANS